MTRFIASPAVKAVGDIVLLLLMMLFVFTVMFLISCFSDTDGPVSDGTSETSSSSESGESEATSTDSGSEETAESEGTSSAGSSSDSSSSNSSTEGDASASETTSAGVTTTAAGSPWYQPCTQNIDCEAPLRCHTSVIGKGHCAGYCESDANCEAPTSGNIAASCWTLNPDPHDAICWLFRAVVSCTFIECPDGLVCYELYDQGDKAVCAAP